jgi:hypothetical protein
MARGWESKSVEAQQADARETHSAAKPRLTREEAAQLREKENLLLARTRILRQLDAASVPRHRALLEATLRDLDCKLAQPRKTI